MNLGANNYLLVYMKHLKSMMLLLIGLCTFYLPNAQSAGDIRWHAAGLSLLADIQSELVRNAFCLSINDCLKQERVLFKSVKQGLELEIYGVTDEATLSAIAGKAANLLVAKRIPTIQILVFDGAHREQMSKPRSLFGRKEHSSIHLRWQNGNN